MKRPGRQEKKSLLDYPPKGFSPARGKFYFVAGLVGVPLMVGISALSGSSIPILGAVGFVLTFSVLAGVVGMFTDNVGF